MPTTTALYWLAVQHSFGADLQYVNTGEATKTVMAIAA